MTDPLGLLLVEDDPGDLEAIREPLLASTDPSFRIEHVARVGSALRRLESDGVDVVLLDLDLPDSRGMETVVRVLSAGADVPVVVLTGHEDEGVGLRAVQLGAQDFLRKGGVSPDVLLRCLRYAVERHALLAKLARAAAEASAGERRLRRLVGRSAEGIVVVDVARRVHLANPAAEALFGRTSDDLVGATLEVPVDPGRAREIVILRADGTSVPAEVRVVDLEWEGDRRLLVSLRDLTDRRRAERVALAQEVQRAFLPERATRRIGRLDAAALNESCEDASGDYYDFVEAVGGRLVVPVGDVSGHGLGAALLMAQARASLRTLCRTESDPSRLLASLNESLASDMTQGRFMTLFLASVEVDTRRLRWANAGHVPAFLFRAATGTVERLGPTGLVLGVFPDQEYAAGEEVRLADDDVLLLCSDGATEATSPSGERFGAQRLAQLLSERAGDGAQALVDAVRGALREWTGGRPAGDDLTLVALRASPVAARAVHDAPASIAPAAEPAGLRAAPTRVAGGAAQLPTGIPMASRPRSTTE